MSKQVARAVLKAQKLREGSFDNQGADNAFRDRLVVDYKKFYRLSLIECAEMSSKNIGVVELVYILISNNWNESEGWAKSVLSIEGK